VAWSQARAWDQHSAGSLNHVFDVIQGYTEDKIVMGRIQGDDTRVPVELTVQPGYGLVGFVSPPNEKKS
jgi:hypothetical protein